MKTPIQRFLHSSFCLAFVALAARGQTNYPPVLTKTDAVTQVSQLARLGQDSGSVCPSLQLEGVVTWVSPARDRLVLQDDSGGVLVTADLHHRPDVLPGTRIRLEMSCLNNRKGVSFGTIIDNDGVHASIEKSVEIYLSSGRHPFRLEWFNGPANYDLNLDYQGPGMNRQPVPGNAFFRLEPAAEGNSQWVNGLDCQDYEGNWEELPDFSSLQPVWTGVVSNLDLRVRSRDTHVGLVFSGYLETHVPGLYRFWLRSDDGSKLSLSDLSSRITCLGRADFPKPLPIVPGHPVSDSQKNCWAETEGMVTRINEVLGGLSLEITSAEGCANLRVAAENHDSLEWLLHSRIRARGIAQNASDVDGRMVPLLKVPGVGDLAILSLPDASWSHWPIMSIGRVSAPDSLVPTGSLVHLTGEVISNRLDGFVVRDATGTIVSRTAMTMPAPGSWIELLGLKGSENGMIIVTHSCYRPWQPPLTKTPGLPLTEVIQAKSLNREQARSGYAVDIRGVITANIGDGSVIQDATGSIFVFWNNAVAGIRPEPGDYWEIQGTSYVDFAPNINANRATYLHAGILPEPLKISRSELLNGSLDTRYVEIAGVVTAVGNNIVTLLTRGGKIRLLLHDLDPQTFKNYENAYVRISGVNTPDRDNKEQMAALILMYNASVAVDRPAPADLFDLPARSVSDLLTFDVHADALRRVKVAGQIQNDNHGEYVLSDGLAGLRFKLRATPYLQAGDLVEVVGFPDISGFPLTLNEPHVRVTGRTNLPAAHDLAGEDIINRKYDNTRVALRSYLLSVGRDNGDEVLELQQGSHTYRGRLMKSAASSVTLLPGSLLKLTGTYSGRGGDRASGRDIDSFELLINSPADISVLAYPPWWNVRHILMILGGMTVLAGVAGLWVHQLHRQVKRQTRRLTEEVKSREQAESRRALATERARIASDLHDELGATLTEIRFLGAAESRDLTVPTPTRSRLKKISDKSRLMVSALDEIVWAINPTHDSLSSLASYLRNVTQEFFYATEIRCRFDVDNDLPATPLTTEVRHNLYLVVREALNNAAKHSRATEVWLRIHWQEGVVRITIEDNGSGFNPADCGTGNGLSNMRQRMAKIGGHYEIQSQPGAGAILTIYLPIHCNQNSNYGN